MFTLALSHDWFIGEKASLSFFIVIPLGLLHLAFFLSLWDTSCITLKIIF